MCPLTNPSLDKLNETAKLPLKTGEWPKDTIEISLIGTKLLCFDPVAAGVLYGFNRYFGTPVGIKKPRDHIFDKPLELSLFEGVYLSRIHLIKVKNSDEIVLSTQELFDFAVQIFPRFRIKYPIYEDLRNKNYIVRPGQKFGADFIVYEKGPGIDHASFCIQVLSGDAAEITSLDVVTVGRLANSVKKRFILANPISKTYFQFKWFKP